MERYFPFFFRGPFFRPKAQHVHFLACLRKTSVLDTCILSLYCYPNCKQLEVEKNLSFYEISYKGEGTSKEPVCVEDEIVVFPSGLDFVGEYQNNEKVVLRFLQDSIYVYNAVVSLVPMDSKSVPTVKFFKDKELQKLLCEVPISKIPVTVGMDQRLVPRERPALVPKEGVMAQLVDVKMELDAVKHLELKKDLLLDVKVIKRSVIFRGEVTEKGNVWNLPEAAAYVTFHEGAVPKPLLFTCSVWPPTLRSPPISSDELLVSNVIELLHDGPPELELSGDDKGNVTVALLHSASDLKGYEVVIKQLVDPYDNVWKDLETWHASEIPDVSDWPQLVKATCTLSRCSSFAAIWRLKSFTFTSCTSVAPQFTCVVPDFPDIRVEFPFGSVPADQDFTLTIKVQEFPSNEVEDIGILCGPVIHISSSQNIEHMEPVTIKVPLALRESKHDLSELSNEVIRISYLDSEGKQWRDITGQLEGPVTVKDGIVEFKVKHFSCFCPVCMFTESVALLQDFFHRLSFRLMPQCVHFLTCLCNTTVPDTYGLSLYCYPNFKKAEVEKKLLRYVTPYQGEGKSKEPACVGDRIVVSLIALDFVRESQRNQKLVLRFLGNDISDNSDMALIVRLDSEGVPIVKFSKDEELQKVLCEVPILKTRPASVVPVTESRDQRVAPEERPALVADVEKEEKDNEDQCNPRVKQGTPSDDELEYLASKLGDLWKKLGRRLKILEPKLDDLNKLNEAFSEKGYKMLMHWKESKWCLNMASQAERDANNGARPSTGGSAMRVVTAGGNKLLVPLKLSKRKKGAEELLGYPALVRQGSLRRE